MQVYSYIFFELYYGHTYIYIFSFIYFLILLIELLNH